MTDHYETLGVAATATPDEIKAAYKKLAMQHHPDRNQGDKAAEEKFKETNAAYDILKDADKRAFYDLERQRQRHAPPEDFEFQFRTTNGHGFSPEDIFRHMHEEFHRPRGNRDVHLNLSITLDEAFFGFEREMSYRVPGEGLRTIRLKIPAGVEHGNRVRFVGGGGQADSASPAGNLYVTVAVAPHAVFRRDGRNLIAQASIDAIDAMLGCDTEIQGLDGQKIRLIVPAGVQNGQMLRLRGHGMPMLRKADRGDLFVEMTVLVPRNLTEAQKQLLRRVRDGESPIHE